MFRVNISIRGSIWNLERRRLVNPLAPRWLGGHDVSTGVRPRLYLNQGLLLMLLEGASSLLKVEKHLIRRAAAGMCKGLHSKNSCPTERTSDRCNCANKFSCRSCCQSGVAMICL